jgi:hypothetical protein
LKPASRCSVADRIVRKRGGSHATPAAVDAVRKGQPIPSGTVLTLVQYKAQLDVAGEPLKDANGRFQKGDLVAYTVMEKRRLRHRVQG